MSDTPRTDAFAISDCPGDIAESWTVFARELEREIARLVKGIMTTERTMIVEGNDMIDWGWTTIRAANLELRAALELADKELEASGYGSGTLPRRAIAEALYG